MGESADLGFLHDVLGLVIVAHKTTGEAIKALIVRLHDGAERTAFAGQRPMRQFEVIRSGGDVGQGFSSTVHMRLHYLHQMTLKAKGSQNSRLRKALPFLDSMCVPEREAFRALFAIIAFSAKGDLE